MIVFGLDKVLEEHVVIQNIHGGVQMAQGPRQYGCHWCLGNHKNFITGAGHPSLEKTSFLETQFIQKSAYVT